MDRSVARRTAPLLALAAIASATGCWSRSDGPPTRLVDGTPASAPSVRLDAPTPQILTGVTSTTAKRLPDGTPSGECLRAAREHGATAPVVVRTGVTGLSATYRTASGRALVGCDATHAATVHDAAWCGRAYGRLERGRLLDPRLDLAGCSTPMGDTVAFAWIAPGARTAYVAVRQDGYTEVYATAGGLPVRVTTNAVSVDRSSATFDVSEHSSTGALVRSSLLEVRVAG